MRVAEDEAFGLDFVVADPFVAVVERFMGRVPFHFRKAEFF